VYQVVGTRFSGYWIIVRKLSVYQVVEERHLGYWVVERRLSRYWAVEERHLGYWVVEEDAERIVDGVPSGIHDTGHKFYTELMSKDDNKRSKIEQVT